MADDTRQYPSPPLPSRLGMRHNVSSAAATDSTTGGCGEIVEVQGGHIVRSTGRKDRHSKVCTAKGPRDRRVRLSAHTAIQFYDVQDRLGFDRPSKAVDWLIKKAKTSIDELAQLPPWNPVDAIRHAAANAKPRRNSKSLISQPQQIQEQQQQQQQNQNQNLQFDVGASVIPPAIGFHQNNDNESSFLPPSMDSDSIADTIKSFFPVASTEAPPSQQQLIQSYHHHNHHHHPSQQQQPPDLLSRTNSQNQDLRLSLQSFQDNPPLLLHQQHSSSAAAEPVMFYGQSNLGFDTSTVSWENSQHHHHNNQLNHQSPEFGRIQRLVAWNSGGAADTGNGGSGGGFLFASPSTATTFQPIFGQSQLFSSQRGPLQSSYTPMIRAWFDPHHHHNHNHNHHQSISTATTTDDLNHHHIPAAVHQSAIPGIGFASGEFSGFRIPARFQGEEEEHDGINNKPSSASSISRH